MYENQCAVEPCKEAGSILGGGRKSLTMAENIDFRIATLRDQITRLEKVKSLLASPDGLLNVPLDDLRFAMQY